MGNYVCEVVSVVLYVAWDILGVLMGVVYVCCGGGGGEGQGVLVIS